MPIYEYACQCGADFNRYLPVAEYLSPQTCECGKVAEKVIRTVPMGFIQPDCHYTSPIDGRPITSYSQRRDDMARSGCIEYDPEMKKDQVRRIAAADDALDRKVGDTVDALIEAMPAKKREKLTEELVRGADVSPERGTMTNQQIGSL